MKIWVALLILFLMTGCANAHPTDFRDYALRLDLADGVCSGSAVGKNLILTATHCLKDNRITAINGQPAYALKRIDDGHDHSLVRVSITFKHWAKVGGIVIAGDRVRWIGTPAAQDNVYREGYVARANHDEVWLDAMAFGGDSGSGVYCADGRICGVISAGKAWVRGPFTFTMTVMYPISFTAKDWRAIA